MRKLALLLSLLLVLSALSALSACATAKKPTDGTAEGSAGPSTELPAGPSTEPPTAAAIPADTTPVSDFHWQTLKDGTVSARYNGTAVNIVFPSQIDGKPVTVIAGVSTVRETLVSVTLPDGVREITDEAFKDCASLSEINLPASLEKIGREAFAGCTSLKEIEIASDCLTPLGYSAFVNAGLERVVLHEGITRVPDGTFACTQIEEIVLPSTVRTIDFQAFAACPRLKKVVLNEGLTTVSDCAFAADTALTEIVIPRTVTEIKDMAFTSCEALEKVKFEGNAPTQFCYPPEPLPMEPYNVHFKVCYHATATGFTTPEWNGYQTEIW